MKKSRTLIPIQTEEALRRSDETLRSLASEIKDYAIFILDETGRITASNAGAQRIGGYTAVDIHGEYLSRLYTKEALVEKRSATELATASKRGRCQEEGWRVRKDGSRFLANTVITALRDEKGHLFGFVTIMQEVAKRKEAEEATRRAEHHYRQIFEDAITGIFQSTPQGRYLTVNSALANMMGYDSPEDMMQSVTDISRQLYVVPAQRTKFQELLEREGMARHFEIQLYRKDGSKMWVSASGRVIRENGVIVRYEGMNEDITERKEAQEALFMEKERAQVTLNSIGEAVISTDVSGNVVFLNRIAEKLTGWAFQEAERKPITRVLRVVDATTHENNSEQGERGTVELSVMSLPWNALLIRRDGTKIPIEHSSSSIHDRENRVTGAVIVFRDVSAVREMSLRMTHLAKHDFLTGLSNRMYLEDRISHAITVASRNQRNLAVLFLDLDGFKHINDSLGHVIGDRLLQSVSERLLGCVRGSDAVSRQGGDEFIVLLDEVAHPEDPAVCARRILRAINAPHSINGQTLHISASIGVSVFPEDGRDSDSLIKNADTAMYQAKANGRHGYQFFEAAMNVRAVERQSMEEGLRQALDCGEFTLNYQPKIDLRTGRVAGAEALLRWTHPIKGLIPPAQFIPVAEDSGLILPIGNWVLREACRQSRAWQKQGLPMVPMAVNISAIEFRNEHFLTGLLAILEETGLDPRSLELELTESVLMKHADTTETILKSLRVHGVQLAVDDFGTGYSSLSYLRRFPIDALKIDRSFVQQIHSRETGIVSAIISMGRSLRMRVIAEGVETQEELDFLKVEQCDEAQGYFFSRPLAPMSFVEFLTFGATNLLPGSLTADA